LKGWKGWKVVKLKGWKVMVQRFV